MILQSLVSYYEALEGRNEIPKLGWGVAKVYYAIVLGEEGELKGVIPLAREEIKGKKTVRLPQLMEVPEPVKRSVGIDPNFLCDNSSYLLGFDAKGRPERTEKCFQAARDLHLKILANVDSPMARAIRSYFTKWKPENAKDEPALTALYDEIAAGSNLVFQLGLDYAQEDEKIRLAWNSHAQSDIGDPVMQCLITGEEAAVSRIHAAIKGVYGVQSSGGALVAFNADAYCSYGKEQNYNAPISKYAAFAYTTALNRLLSDSLHKRQLGDATVVYWAEDAEPAYQDLFGAYLTGGDSELITSKDLNGIMGDIAAGRAVDWNKAVIKPDNRFFILGIAPNAARLAVRFFYRDSFGKLVGNLKKHYDRLEMCRPAFDRREYLGLNALLDETVNRHSKDKKPQPLLAGSLARAVFADGPYPEALYMGVMLRIRAESDITRGRAAIIKAFLLKNHYDKTYGEALTVELNDQCTYLPYLLGRLFSLYEALQQAANPKINATIKDRYFNSASATPATVMPLLTKLAQSHLKKLETQYKIYYEKQIGELTDKIRSDYPARLNLKDQGIFQLGYYHQTQKRYHNKEDKQNV